jgi:hypothetical protein
MAKGSVTTMHDRRDRRFGVVHGVTALLLCLLVGFLIARGV